jgi:hypothetical protein
MQGTVVTAKELERATIERIEQKISKLFEEPVQLIQKIDPTLLAGVVVYAGGRRFDGSAKGLLEGHGEDRTRQEAQAVRSMVIDAREIGEELQIQVSHFSNAPGVRPVGTILSIGDGIAHVDGLAGCRYN